MKMEPDEVTKGSYHVTVPLDAAHRSRRSHGQPNRGAGAGG